MVHNDPFKKTEADQSNNLLTEHWTWGAILCYGWQVGLASVVIFNNLLGQPFLALVNYRVTSGNTQRTPMLVQAVVVLFLLLLPLVHLCIIGKRNDRARIFFLLTLGSLFLMWTLVIMQLGDIGITVGGFLLSIAIGILGSIIFVFGIPLYLSTIVGLITCRKWSLSRLKLLLLFAILGMIVMIPGCSFFEHGVIRQIE